MMRPSRPPLVTTSVIGQSRQHGLQLFGALLLRAQQHEVNHRHDTAMIINWLNPPPAAPPALCA